MKRSIKRVAKRKDRRVKRRAKVKAKVTSLTVGDILEFLMELNPGNIDQLRPMVAEKIAAAIK